MHYSVYEGMQNTWSDRFGSITNRITSHNWLPAGVAGLVVLWLGLIFAAMQAGTQGTGAPSDLTATRDNPPMAVTAAAEAPTDLNVSAASSNTTSMRAVSAGTAAVAATSATSTPTSENPVATLTDPIIGGRGGSGDGGEAPIVETPALPTTPDPSVELEVDPPITDPIGVEIGTDDGLQAGVDLGNLLEVDLDLGLGL